MGTLRAFLTLCFQPPHIQIGGIFTTKCFESQKTKLVQRTITKPHERQVHQNLFITVAQMKPLTHDLRTADFIATRWIQLGKGRLYLDLVLDFLKDYARDNLPEKDTGLNKCLVLLSRISLMIFCYISEFYFTFFPLFLM